MTESYTCPKCHRLVKFRTKDKEWILTWCPNCGFEVEVKVEEDTDET